MRVLFVGNSYTHVNNLPELVVKLAEAAGGEPLEVLMDCPGGMSLRQHVESLQTQAALRAGPWNWVVLQDQSQLPAFPLTQVQREMYPAVRTLEARAHSQGAKTMMYMTWGHQHGDQANLPSDTFEDMQARLRTSYETIARQIDAAVAPVGLAWLEAASRRPEIALWDADGSHPTLLGSYLAACVIFQALYGKSAEKNAFTADLDKATALFLQEVATDVMVTYRL